MTECNQESFAFTAHLSRRAEAGFTAGQVSTEGDQPRVGRQGADNLLSAVRLIHAKPCCRQVTLNVLAVRYPRGMSREHPVATSTRLR
jgi:hypothetical protein